MNKKNYDMITLIRSIGSIWFITAIITHLWTTIIAFSESGFFAALLSLFIPFLSEIYWIIQMWGENNAYTSIALIHLLIAIPISIFSDEK